MIFIRLKETKIYKKNMNSLTELIFEDVNADFGWGKYGDFKVLIRKRDGYINATKLCKDGGKELLHWRQTVASQKLVKELSWLNGIPLDQLLETHRAGKENYELYGTYVHHKLIPHIASWVSPKFAIMVSEIVNNFLVREYKEEIRRKEVALGKKQEKIDELIQKVDKQSETIDKQTKKIDELLAVNHHQTRVINVINENVIETVNTLHHVSDKSVPYERLPDPLVEQLVVITKEENNYTVIRGQRKYVDVQLRKLRKARIEFRIVVQMDLRPNARELWIAVKEALKAGRIEVKNTKFEMAEAREAWLVETLNACNQEKYDELLETKENIREKLETIQEEPEPAPERAWTRDTLLKLLLEELRDICRRESLRGWSRLSKARLVDFILTSLQ